MKIAMISDALIVGGAERQVLLSASELQKLGHTTKVIIYHPYIKYEDFIRKNNVDVVEIKSRSSSRVARINALGRYLRKGSFDVVHGFKGCSTISAAPAAKLAGIKTVFGGFRSQYSEGMAFRLAHKIVDKLLVGWIVNSRVVADSMVKALGIDLSKLHVVYNGVCPETFELHLSKTEAKHKLGLPQEQPVVTMVARLDPVKNHKMLLKAASIVLRRRLEVRFLIVGDGPLRDVLQDQVESLGLSDEVLFLGIRSDIADVLAATDIAVTTSDAEGFPNALIEPMSVGIPVVSTHYPGIDELLTEPNQGLIVPRNDPGAMAEKLTQLMDDSQLRKEIGQEGMKTVLKRFSPAILAQNLISVYQQHVNNTKS